MAIEDGYKDTFQVLYDHIRSGGRLCLMECERIGDGNKVIVLCCASVLADGSGEFYPVAEMISSAHKPPTEQYLPPDGCMDIDTERN